MFRFFEESAAAVLRGIRRQLRRPVTPLVIILTLGLGVGLVGAVVSLLEALLYRPVTSFADPHRVVAIVHARAEQAREPGAAQLQPLSLADYRRLERESRTFASLAAGQVVRVLLRAGEHAEKTDGEMVTASYFEVAGVVAQVGRFFAPDEARFGSGASVVVLADDLWRSRFAADPGVVGRRIDLNGHPFTIVGVAPRGFVGANRLDPADFWVPLSSYRQVFLAPQLVEQPEGRFLNVYGRLGPGNGIGQLRAELELIERSAEGMVEESSWSLAARPVHDASAGLGRRARRGGLTLLALTVSLLSIAALNIAVLLATRAREREPEVALRLALGATPRQLARAELRSSLCLAAAGGAVGLAVAALASRLLWSLRPPYLDERILEPGLSLTVLGLALGASAALGLLFAWAPWARIRKQDLTVLLREGGRGLVRGTTSWWRRHSPVVVQVALATAILGVAGLFCLSLIESRRVDPGFSTEDLVLASFDLQLEEFPPQRIAIFQRQLRERLAAIPGARAVALAENRLLGGFRLWREVAAAGSDLAQPEVVGSGAVGEGFFDAAGIERLAGRSFAAGDRSGPPVAILNRTLARRLFGERSAIGRRLTIDDEGSRVEVVGVVGDTAIMTLGEEPRPFLYLPFDRSPPTRFTVHVALDDERGAARVREVIRGLDPTVPIDGLDSIAGILGEALWVERLSAGLLTVLAVVALLLAGVGVYGAATAEALSRRREIGIRLALGERRAAVIRGALRSGLAAVALGAALGLLLSWGLGQVVGSLLYDAGRIDGMVLGAAIAALLLIGGLSHVGPAVRAAGVDPAVVLRRP